MVDWVCNLLIVSELDMENIFQVFGAECVLKLLPVIDMSASDRMKGDEAVVRLNEWQTFWRHGGWYKIALFMPSVLGFVYSTLVLRAICKLEK